MASYWFTDMGNLKAGNYVEIRMNMAANVRVMNMEAFENYKKKMPHDFIGGYVRFTPYAVTLPADGHWFVAVDRGGRPGTVTASVSIYQTAGGIKRP